MKRFPFKKLYRLHQRLSDLADKMGEIEQKINYILNDFNFDLFENDDFVNGIHAYASNGEFGVIVFEEYVKVIKEAIKELKSGME